MNDFQALCECERDGEPSCADWLGGLSDTPPKHYCVSVMLASVKWFARERFPPAARRLTSEYPLPLGVWAVAAWNERQRAWAEQSEREWEAYQKAGGCWAAMHQSLAKTGSPHYWEPEVLTAEVFPAWFTPLVTQPDAWLGLAGRRTTEAGTAWLLGLTELTFISDDFRYLQWKLAEPVVLVEACPRTAADLDALTAAVRPLLEWYTATLLGKTLTAPVGRPPGNERQQIDEFLALYEPAYRRVWKELDRLPQEEEIAGEMGMSPAMYYRRKRLLKKHGISLPRPTEPDF